MTSLNLNMDYQNYDRFKSWCEKHLPWGTSLSNWFCWHQVPDHRWKVWVSRNSSFSSGVKDHLWSSPGKVGWNFRKGTWWDLACWVLFPLTSLSGACSCLPEKTFASALAMNVVISHLSNKVNNQLLALELGGGKPPPGSLALLCAAKLHEGIPGRIRINQRQYSTNAYMDSGHSLESKLKTLSMEKVTCTWYHWLTWPPSLVSSRTWCQSAELGSRQLRTRKLKTKYRRAV